MPFGPSMLVDPTPMYPRRRRVKPKAAVAPLPPPVEGPVLVSAVFQPYEGATVTLVFDRAILVEAFDAAAISVTDVGSEGTTTFDGSGGASVANETTVVIALEVVTGPPPDQGEVTMTATNGVGIFAQDGGAAWAGANALSLPFGEMAAKQIKKPRRKRAA